MSPSKKQFWIELVAQLVLIVPFVYNFIPLVRDPQQWAADARVAYAEGIATGNLTNWHSCLYLFEGHWLLRGMRDVVGVDVSSHTVMACMASVMLVLLCISLAMLLHWLMKQNILYALVAGISPLFVKSGASPLMSLTLDYYYMVASVVCLVSLLYLNHRWKWVRVVAHILFWLMLVHIPEYRKNALLTVPALTFCYFCITCRSWSFKRSAGMAVLCTCGLAVMMFLFPTLLPNVTKTHPQYVMMACDLRVAALCRGEFEQELECHEKQFGIRHKYDEDFNQAGAYDVRASWLSIVPGRMGPGRNDQCWDSFAKHYMETLFKYPASVISARMIQALNFYTRDYTPEYIERFWNGCWPALAAGGDPWHKTKTLQWPRRLSLRLFAMGMLVCLLLFYAKSIRKQPQTVKFAVAVGMVALLYALSFLPAVPTADDRYHMPFVLLCYISISICFVHILITKICKRCLNSGGN